MPSTFSSHLERDQANSSQAPARCVALLRGINVGGHGSIKMSDLRSWLLNAGFEGVETYLQSGNVLFVPNGMDAPAQTISQVLSNKAGLNVHVFIRTSSALDEVVKGNPFPESEPTQLHVAFLSDAQREFLKDVPDVASFSPESFHADEHEIYLFLPSGMGRAVLPRKLSVLKLATIRNWKTVCNLADLARAR